MHREPVDVVARRDLWLDGLLVTSGVVYSVESFDRSSGDMVVGLPPVGGNLCTERAVLREDRRPEFRIRWRWTTSTELGGRAVQLGALALIAPWFIAAGALIESESPVLRRMGQRIHPKRGHR
jgi:hypothetical protein